MKCLEDGKVMTTTYSWDCSIGHLFMIGWFAGVSLVFCVILVFTAIVYSFLFLSCQ